LRSNWRWTPACLQFALWLQTQVLQSKS